MKNIKFNTVRFKGNFFIEANFSLEKTAEIINKTLNLNLSADDSGYYEEFPAFSSSTLNIQMALLGTPKLNFRIEGNGYKYYNFSITDNNKLSNSESINLGTNFVAILNDSTELSCKEEWSEGQIMDGCLNVMNENKTKC